jgi:hypothetical protein
MRACCRTIRAACAISCKRAALARNIWNVMPFDNIVVTGRFPGAKLPAIVLVGRTVDPQREYALAVTDFTAANQNAHGQVLE